MNIYVGNLSFDTRDNDLRAAFEAYGAVETARVTTDRETGRSRGFGFVEMADAAAGQNAIRSLDGQSLQGRNIKVNEARPREERPARSGGGGGGGYNRY